MKNNQEEENTQKSVDLAQAFEMAIMITILHEIKHTLGNEKSKIDALVNVRNKVNSELSVFIPLLLESSLETLEMTDNQLKKEYKNIKVPKGSNHWHKEIEKEFQKYIKSKGLVLNGQSLEAFFLETCEEQAKKIVAGKISLDKAMEEVCKIMGNNGISVVTYPQGGNRAIRKNIDVYVRQQVLYAQKESTQDTRYKVAKEMGTTIFEIDAHPDARPSHQVWQGKRFDTTGKDYPTFEQLSHGNGSTDDYGCLHRIYPVLKTDSPMYTTEDLKNINTPPFKFGGMTFDGYQAKQQMRKYEREIRSLKRQKILMKEANLDTKKIKAQLRLKNSQYNSFAKAYGTYPRNNRTRVFQG